MRNCNSAGWHRQEKATTQRHKIAHTTTPPNPSEVIYLLPVIRNMAMTSHKHIDMAISGPDDLSPRHSPSDLQVNDVFPQIELIDENGRPITLHAENGRPRLIVFYRGAFCNYCEGTYFNVSLSPNFIILFCTFTLNFLQKA